MRIQSGGARTNHASNTSTVSNSTSRTTTPKVDTNNNAAAPIKPLTQNARSQRIAEAKMSGLAQQAALKNVGSERVADSIGPMARRGEPVHINANKTHPPIAL